MSDYCAGRSPNMLPTLALRCVALRWDVDGDLRLSDRTRADVVITIVACPPRIARTSCVSPELSVGRRSPPVAYPGSTCLLPDRGWGYETWHEVVGYVVEEVDVEARRDGLHRHSVRHARLRGRLCDPSFWAWRLTSSNCPLPALSACSHPGRAVLRVRAVSGPVTTHSLGRRCRGAWIVDRRSAAHP